MKAFGYFLIDIWRMVVITGQGRPDAEVISWIRNDHLLHCNERELVPGTFAEVEGKVWVSASIMCGHQETTDVEYSLNADLWILRKLLGGVRRHDTPGR